MSDAITFLMGVLSGGVAGWILREAKIEWDRIRREDRILRDIKDRIERERMT